ncbi:hypothetical protein [uncultured Corynebacterium sp.]|uniref:hypothetical protein n=1 Tax=uncultured Corynebacterium sp. TaxID=159447 RepID=UPI002618707E|nr:hypothetical protein [uncultured Corynebacterium sp.]
MAEFKGFIKPHAPSVREGAVKEFAESWGNYSSPSAAVRDIASRWGVGRTTLTEWLHDEGKWPRTTVGQLRRLQRENQALREQLKHLQEE